jgi:hypothetical protein
MGNAGSVADARTDVVRGAASIGLASLLVVALDLDGVTAVLGWVVVAATLFALSRALTSSA